METFLIEIPVPSMGATVEEMTLVDLGIESGQTIAKGEKIAEFESAKSVFEFEAPCDGVIREVLVRAGDILPCGAPFLRIETADVTLVHLKATETAVAAAPAKSAQRALVRASPSPRPAPVARAERDVAVAVPAVPPGWTPRAVKVAREAGFDPAGIEGIVGTGPGGRISGDDVLKWMDGRPAGGNGAPAAAPEPATVQKTDGAVSVAGIGYAVPNNVRSNTEILKEFPGRTEEEFIKLTGIRERRYAGDTESATSLAATASRHALQMAGIDPAEIDGVIVATLLADQPVPSAASALAKLLGMRNALTFDLNAACAGWLYALEVGRSLIKGGSAQKLLVVTAELLSRITNPKDQATAFLFGDGAGAAVLTDAAGGHRLNRMKLAGDAEYYDAIRRTGGGALRPMPRPGDNLDDFYIQMDGGTVFKHAVIAFADMIEDTMRRHDLGSDDVAWIVPHQANERILKAVGKRVGIPYERFVMTLGKYGNTSAASVSMALGWAAEEGIFNPGDKIIFCAVGAGLTFAGGLLVW